MNWHITDPLIRCIADSEGAQVFTVFRGSKELRVLTFSQADADRLAAEYQEETNPAEQTLL